MDKFFVMTDCGAFLLEDEPEEVNVVDCEVIWDAFNGDQTQAVDFVDSDYQIRSLLENKFFNGLHPEVPLCA